MKDIGIRLDADYDLEIKVHKDARGNIVGGLTTGDITHQNQALILFAQKGEIKEYPLIGVGLGNASSDEDLWLWKREVREQIENDGQKIETLIFTEKEFYLKAKY